MNTAFLKSLREFEAGLVLPLLPANSRILEIGAGAGWQARIFAAHGHIVKAVDLADSQYKPWRDFPVDEYDGSRLPFADGSFDVVYTSSVLEHLPNLPELDLEIGRVLRPQGAAIHVLPRGRWCFWTLVTHIIKGTSHPGTFSRQPFPLRHGVEGRWYGEFFLFGKKRWQRRFRQLGWDIAGIHSNRMVYSGNSLLHEHVGIGFRKALALISGGVCLIYVLRRRPPRPSP
ncbi:MAG TPA: methyltransferase domain-containing protein [Acidobacteriota bacterium]